MVSGDWTAERAHAPDAAAVFGYLAMRRIVEDQIPVLAVAYSSSYGRLLEQEDGANLPGASDLLGGALYQSALAHGAVLAGIARSDGTPCLAPPSDTPVAPGAPLLLIGPANGSRAGAPADQQPTGAPAP
ncbi:MAG: hypothetical protein QJR03_01900 [Sphaerobacter sp.]|nr:hypothetical protein [Sphaerobacter sp.]